MMREWIKVAHSPTATMVTVTVQEANIVARWTQKSSIADVRANATHARTMAVQLLDEPRGL